jgi:hypothetical protein
MADVTISNLPDLSITGTNYLVHTNGSSTGRATVNQLKIALAVPAAQVQSDWNAASGVASILNKPSQQLAQVWGYVDGNVGNGASALVRGYNCSVVKTNLGRFTITYINNVNIPNAVIATSADGVQLNAYIVKIAGRTNTSCSVITTNTGGTYTNSNWSFVIF